MESSDSVKVWIFPSSPHGVRIFFIAIAVNVNMLIILIVMIVVGSATLFLNQFKAKLQVESGRRSTSKKTRMVSVAFGSGTAVLALSAPAP